ncbi:hypothetical protein J2X63_003180 [Agromyces sp. 3263]|uniref:DUF6093 family protein n=1 Tax=Agromyces sp. 3263 TaxID=2817750 RepID=UPI00285792A5|nr:DUF6093 family protein [Agromyces sp. 3263]MDR6907472.1 hypothetical protein [Agromyces sp. 3263]
MSIARGALSMGRGVAESLMTDTVRIFRRAYLDTADDDGNPEFTDTDVWSGPARLVLRSAAAIRDVDAQSQLLAVQSPRLDVPVEGTGGVKNADRFVILSSATDPESVGLEGFVSGMFPQTYSTARRLPVEVVS